MKYTKQEVTHVHHWTDRLFSVRTTRSTGFRFNNGQFVMMGLEVDGSPLLRAYSMASANYDEHLEFFSIKVSQGALTSRLAHIKPGDEVYEGQVVGEHCKDNDITVNLAINKKLSNMRATGSDGVVTMADVKQAAADGSAPMGGARAPAPAAASQQASAPAPTPASRDSGDRTRTSASGRPMRTQPPSVSASGQPEQLKGVRRNMARVMADAHAQVVPTTLVDDADLHGWEGKQDITARLIRSICAAAKAVPALNAWFDGKDLTRTMHPHVDIGIAVDTDDGLFVPALRNADVLDAAGIRAGIKRLRQQVEDRSIPASELSGYTISLSNFGMFAGRYATPVVVPPCVAIVGAGKLSHDVVAVMGGVEVHRRMPISLTFDHRAATGGEAARFLKALLDDLSLPN